ncbi:MAG: hypothetical protein RB288_05295 [Bacteroidales bacterium]|jgi:hypothetical protein|nr:hypothetical protein [Bacteroidales bacterium]
MKKIIALITFTLLAVSASAQWKAQSAETYEQTYRMAFVTSRSGTETLRLLRAVPGEKGTTAYDQISGQILLNRNIGTDYNVYNLVFRFDDSPKMYILDPEGIKQQWDANVRKYIIDSDWKTWRIGDTRDKQGRKSAGDAGADHKKEIIDLMKASGKVTCQIVLLRKGDGSQSMISTEFTLQNSTKSINYLFK